MSRHRSRPSSLLAVAALACGLVAGPGAAAASAGKVATFDSGSKVVVSSTGSVTKSKKRSHSAAECTNTNTLAGEASQATLIRATVCLLNKERAERGVRTLRLDDRLSAAARSHTLDMVREHYFAHVSKSGSDMVDRLRRTGYLSHTRSWMVGENLAWGSGGRSTPARIVDAWMHSAGHRQNILTRRFREIGVGLVFRAPTASYSTAATYTTTFGARS
jgi:uncharacterized protein YkwD